MKQQMSILEAAARHSYYEIKSTFTMGNDIMVPTQEFISHVFNNFYANHFREHRLESWISTIDRGRSNHDLVWQERVEFEEHAITAYTTNNYNSGRVTLYLRLIESIVGRDQNAEDIVLAADTFYYYMASDLIRMTKELYELNELKDKGGISESDFKAKEEVLVRQYEEREDSQKFVRQFPKETYPTANPDPNEPST